VTKVILFDLSETIIAGLVGIEKLLSIRLGIDEGCILPAFGGELLGRLCRGELTEDQYLEQILARQGWEIPIEELKQVIRRNFHTPVPGMWGLLSRLSARYELALLSDHAREWVAYIQDVHPSLAIFQEQFYSFELGQLKNEPSTFERVLAALGCSAAECLFVDDNPANLAAAECVGLFGIRFAGSERLEMELAETEIR
jgi:HAD superfamily hydrolase (TIGR01509 family)